MHSPKTPANHVSIKNLSANHISVIISQNVDKIGALESLMLLVENFNCLLNSVEAFFEKT